MWSLPHSWSPSQISGRSYRIYLQFILKCFNFDSAFSPSVRRTLSLYCAYAVNPRCEKFKSIFVVFFFTLCLPVQGVWSTLMCICVMNIIMITLNSNRYLIIRIYWVPDSFVHFVWCITHTHKRKQTAQTTALGFHVTIFPFAFGWKVFFACSSCLHLDSDNSLLFAVILVWIVWRKEKHAKGDGTTGLCVCVCINSSNTNDKKKHEVRKRGRDEMWTRCKGIEISTL